MIVHHVNILFLGKVFLLKTYYFDIKSNLEMGLGTFSSVIEDPSMSLDVTNIYVGELLGYYRLIGNRE